MCTRNRCLLCCFVVLWSGGARPNFAADKPSLRGEGQNVKVAFVGGCVVGGVQGMLLAVQEVCVA